MTGRPENQLPDIDLAHMQCQAQWPRQYAAGRRCCHDGCKTILSRYNPGTTCDLHRAPPDFMVYLGRRFKVCDTCGRLDAEKAFQRLTPDEYATTCLRCEAKQKRAADKAARDAAKVRRCLRCGQTKPVGDVHWVPLRNPCRACVSDIRRAQHERDNGRRNRQNRAKLDRYYIKTHGMTRAEYRGNS